MKLTSCAILASVVCAILLINDNLAAQTPNNWVQKANFAGAARSGYVSFSIGTKGYMVTGQDASYKRETWEYDPATDAWTQKANFGGSARSLAAGFSIGAKGYVGTGYDGNHRVDFWEYDPATDAWTQKANFGGTGRRYAVGFSVGSKGYMGLGSNGSSTYYSDLWEYNPSTDTWTQKASIPTVAGVSGRINTVAAGTSTKGYVVSGWYMGAVLKDLWEYNPVTDIWTHKADVPATERTEAHAFVIADKLYFGGGYYYNYLYDFYEYSPATDTWTQRANIPGSGRGSGGAFAIGNKGYLVAGQDNSSIITDVEAYTPPSTNPIQWGNYGMKNVYCQESAFNLAFSTNNTYNTGNVFSLQLSNASGSFASPTTIGSRTATGSNSINATLPSGVSGAGYRMRLVSSSPAAVGDTAYIAIAPKYAVFDTGKLCNGRSYLFGGTYYTSPGNYSHHFSSKSGCDSFVTITLVSTPIPAPPSVSSPLIYCKNTTPPALSATGQSLRWYENDQKLGAVYTTAPVPVTAIVGPTVWYVSQTVNTCESPLDSIIVTILPLPKPTITANGLQLHTGSFAAYQWNLAGAPIAGANGNSYSVTDNGIYTVTVTDTSGCVGTSAAYTISGLSAPTISYGTAIVLYPEPVTSDLNIVAPVPVNAEIISTDGKLLVKVASATRVSLGNLVPGIYFIRISTADGRMLAVRKITRQ